MSVARTRRRSSFAAARASTPEPAPRSRIRPCRRRIRCAIRSRARRQPRVEPCSPEPNATPASIRSKSRPAAAPGGKWVPRRTKRRPTSCSGKAAAVRASQPSAATPVRLSGATTPVHQLGKEERGSEQVLVVAFLLHPFDAPQSGGVIREQADGATDGLQRRFIGRHGRFGHIERQGLQGGGVAGRHPAVSHPSADTSRAGHTPFPAASRREWALVSGDQAGRTDKSRRIPHGWGAAAPISGPAWSQARRQSPPD